MSAPYTGPGVSVHVSFHIDPAKVDDFLAELRPVFEAVTAEPNCVFFEVYQSPETPGEFRFIENWNESLDWIVNVQLKKPYYEPHLGRTESMWLKPREIQVFERMPNKEWVSAKEEYFK